MTWRPSVHPLIPPRIPRTPVIVPVPVVSNRELHDRDPEARRVRVERNVTALVVINDIRRIEPSATVFKRYIAPAPVVEAAHHLDRRIGIELRHHWIAVVRTCIDAGGMMSRDRVLRSSGSGQNEQIRAKHKAQVTWGSHRRTSEALAATHGRSKCSNDRSGDRDPLVHPGQPVLGAPIHAESKVPSRRATPLLLIRCNAQCPTQQPHRSCGQDYRLVWRTLESNDTGFASSCRPSSCTQPSYELVCSVGSRAMTATPDSRRNSSRTEGVDTIVIKRPSKGMRGARFRRRASSWDE